jgi:hypothetical protein
MAILSKIPLRAFLYANLAIGLLVVLANGAAIALVLVGRGGTVSDRVPEMTLWFAAGALLLASVLYGFFRAAGVSVLRFQLFVLIALVAGIAARALLALTWTSTIDAQMVWGPGFFTLLVVYAVALVWRLRGRQVQMDSSCISMGCDSGRSTP